MNKVWSEENKSMQLLLKKEETFSQSIDTLLALRRSLFAEVTRMARELPPEAFWQMPFARAAGYHSKTLAYSVWHVFRIEDIVVHELIVPGAQVLSAGGFRERIGADRVTTGNELQGQQLMEFSRSLDVPALVDYAGAVKTASDEMLRSGI